MKIIGRKERKDGKRIVTVELDENETLFAVDERAHYRMGYPHEDIVTGNLITEATQVYWCVVEQRWSEA